MNYYLTVLSPIDYIRGGSNEKLESLANVLANLPTRQPNESEDDHNETLFSDTPTVHMARFLIIDEVPVQMGNEKSGRLASKYLLFIAELDGDRDSFLDQLFKTRCETVCKIWGNCFCFPGQCNAEDFRNYINDYEIKTTLPYCHYPSITQPNISRTLRNRQKLTDFVTSNQSDSAEELLSAWHAFRDQVETSTRTRDQAKEVLH